MSCRAINWHSNDATFTVLSKYIFRKAVFCGILHRVIGLGFADSPRKQKGSAFIFKGRRAKKKKKNFSIYWLNIERGAFTISGTPNGTVSYGRRPESSKKPLRKHKTSIIFKIIKCATHISVPQPMFGFVYHRYTKYLFSAWWKLTFYTTV